MAPSLLGSTGPQCHVQTTRRGCSLMITRSSKDFTPDNRLQKAGNKTYEDVG